MNATTLLLLALAQAQKAPADFAQRSEEMEFVRTETGFTLPRMTFEADATLAFLSYDDYRGTRNFDLDVRAFTVEAAMGITDWAQGELKIPYLRIDPDPGSKESGISDLVLEGKASLRQGSSPIGLVPIDLAAGFRIALPTGDEDEGLGREHAAFGLFAAASYPFFAWLAGHGEIWTEWQSEEKPLHGVNIAAELYPWIKELSLLAAINYSREGSESAAVAFVPGAEYRFKTPNPRMSVGLGLPIGITSRAEDFGVIADFQVRF
jgi:hypothetical protein